MDIKLGWIGTKLAFFFEVIRFFATVSKIFAVRLSVD